MEVLKEHWALIAASAAALAVAGLLVLLAPPLYKAFSTVRSPEHEEEKAFRTELGGAARFPSLAEPASRTLSVVVPAYNEEKRIGAMLDEMLAQLRGMARRDPSFTWEIIVVDDGSRKDDTAGYVQRRYVEPNGSDAVRLCKLVKNVGKGGAVRKGVLRARGAYILFADADGATKAHEVAAVLTALRKVEHDGLGIAVGSRAHMAEEQEAEAGGAAGAPKARRSPFRRLLMAGFKTLLSLLVGGLGVKDTQCGFKMFTRAAARLVFPAQHIERWAFDVELLYLGATVHRLPITEVPVEWAEVDGSKVDVMSDSLQMARDIAAIRLAYMLGVWRADDAALPHWRSTDLMPGQQQGQGQLQGKGAASGAGAAAAEPGSPRSTGSRSRSPAVRRRGNVQ